MIRMMTARTLGVFCLAGLILLSGCSGGGSSDPAPVSTTSAVPPPISPPPVAAQPDMLTATPHGLLRGKANGQGQQLIFSRQNLHQPAFSGEVFLANSLVYYPRQAPSIILDYPNQDIWSVRADGSQDHAVLNTTADEFVKDASGNVAIYEQNTYTLAQGLDHGDYGSLRDGATLTVLPIHERFTQYRFMVGARAFFNNEQQIFSTNVDGSGLSTHATVHFPVTLFTSAAFDGTIVYREYNADNGSATLKTVPLSGGSPSSLDDGQSYVAYAGHVGERVVSHRCTIDASQIPSFSAGPCDVVSVNADGSGLMVLASDPANEAVQGIIGDQVIIRRNLGGNDHLIAVPVAGGPEKFLMTMTDSEFIQFATSDRLIVRRPSGAWTLDLNGVLKQIGNVHPDSGFIVVGNAFCMNQGLSAWCMPLDGSGSAVQIAPTGRILGVLSN